MRNIRFLCGLVLLMSQTAYAHSYASGETDSSRLKKMGQSLETQILRSFPELDKYVQQNARTSPMLNVPYGTTAEFTPEYIAANYPIADVVADNRTQAANTFAEIERKGNFTDYLTPNDLVELPIGMKKRMGNTLVTIGVSRAKFMSQYSELTVFCKIEIPQGNKVLFFGLDGVKLSNGGGLIGDANLVLLGDFQVPVNGNNFMLILKGGFDMRTGDVSNLTYAKLQCGGVKEIGIQAEIALPRGLVKPVGC